MPFRIAPDHCLGVGNGIEDNDGTDDSIHDSSSA